MPFTPQVTAELCDEAGGRCAAPHCKAPTGRPKPESPYMRNGGEGAHICGEKPNAPRYNSLQPEEDRASARNGIWLCPSCHRTIDRYPDAYSPELLHYWKTLAQRDQQDEFLQPRTPRGSFDTEAELRKARAFLESHRATVGALHWLLAAHSRNPSWASGVEVTDDISSMTRHLGRQRGVGTWDNRSPDWCFAPELQNKQQELTRLVEMVNKSPAFALFPIDRHINLHKLQFPGYEPRYADPQAVAIGAYIQFFQWFEASLSDIIVA